MSFEQQMNAILANAQRHETRMLEASRSVLEGWGEDAVIWMRESAPWHDHSGRARRGLTFVRQHPADPLQGGQIALVHGVSYGDELEIDNGGENAIIGPAVATLGGELVADLKRKVWR
jgi:hypothetical protein